MTDRDAASRARIRANRLQFDRYVLDLDRGCLSLGGTDIALRPKTFSVLHCLIENSGRLVSKDELFAAVWPKLVVTDDTLVQSISELRRALGDDGARLITTIPRRGYRFEIRGIGGCFRRPVFSRCRAGFGCVIRYGSAAAALHRHTDHFFLDDALSFLDDALWLSDRIVRLTRSRCCFCCRIGVEWHWEQMEASECPGIC